VEGFVKILALTLPGSRTFRTPGSRSLLPLIATALAEILALLAAAAAAAAIVLLSVWAAGLEAVGVASAATWGLGFVFFGFAVDNRGAAALLQLATGAALLALAWLQFSIAPNYAIAAGLLISGWVAVGLFGRLRQ
jgi:hypothetical protein